MRLLHTADVHLAKDQPRTIQALDETLATAETHDVDLVTISGDLFDSPKDANELRPELRDRFQNTSFEILAIPGNHDADVYARNLEFGQQLRLLLNKPCERRQYDDVSIVGVPFAAEFTDDIYQTLKQQATRDATNILLIHCTVDIGYAPSDAGSEGQIQYCPVQSATLAELGYDYVLAGHIHASYQRRALSRNQTFIYPGSPVSHSRSETGPRHASLIDTATNTTRAVELDTHYYDREHWTITPEDTQQTLDEIEAWVAEHSDESCDLTVTVDGFIDQPETEFAASLREAAAPATVTNRTRNATTVYAHPLYERFSKELEQRTNVENPTEVERVFVESLAELISSGEVRP